MGTYVEIAKTGDLRDGEMARVDRDGHELLLARVNGLYYALDARCPHMGGDLSRGTLNGTVVTCPRHHSQFDVRDGHVVRWTDWTGLKLAAGKLLRSPRSAHTYPVKTEGASVLADLEPGAGRLAA